MLDQSFSSKNFEKILDYENRKGLYLDNLFFPSVEIIDKKIKINNSEIRRAYSDQDRFPELSNTRTELKKEKQSELEKQLKIVSDKILNKDFKIALEAINIPGAKTVYKVKKTAEIFFAIKQLQWNISRLYKVKQSNRQSIVNQTCLLLNDAFPKYILKTDLKNFYESIPHDRLISDINKENLLTFFSKKLIRQILTSYQTLAETSKGVPRGIGISPLLTEMYMRDLDQKIKELPNVTFYARYVDDIIIIFTPNSRNDDFNYKNEIETVVDGFDLELNEEKTRTFDMRKNTTLQTFSFLGYDISFGDLKKSITITLTQKKIDKYLSRITKLLEEYNRCKKYNQKKARKLMLLRLNYLTGNTRLKNNKSNALIGIYFSHSLINTFDQLQDLDNQLYSMIDAQGFSDKLKNRLKKFSFKKSFETKRFTDFTIQELSDIIKVWK